MPTGLRRGQKWLFEDWQVAWLRDFLDPDTREIGLSVARKNGKSGMCAVLLAAYLCGPFAYLGIAWFTRCSPMIPPGRILALGLFNGPGKAGSWRRTWSSGPHKRQGRPWANYCRYLGNPGAGGDDDPLSALKRQFETMKGKLALVETSQGGWGDKMSTPKNDWVPQRIGADPPAPLVNLREQAIITLCQACGIPPGLVSSSDATSTRESWRMFLHVNQ